MTIWRCCSRDLFSLRDFLYAVMTGSFNRPLLHFTMLILQNEGLLQSQRHQAGACVSLHVHPGGVNAAKSATRYNHLGVLRWKILTWWMSLTWNLFDLVQLILMFCFCCNLEVNKWIKVKFFQENNIPLLNRFTSSNLNWFVKSFRFLNQFLKMDVLYDSIFTTKGKGLKILLETLPVTLATRYRGVVSVLFCCLFYLYVWTAGV